MTNLKDYVNWKLTHADKTAEAEGYPLVLENCKANKRMKQLEIYGNSFQDGTPTPDNPIEVESVGVKSVNLFDIDNTNYDDGCLIVPNGGANINANYITTNFLEILKPNKSYTVSFNQTHETAKTTNRCVAYDSNQNVIGTLWDLSCAFGKQSSNFTTPDNLAYIRIGMRKTDEDFQIQEGSTATPYEPYGKYKIPVVHRGVNLFDSDLWLDYFDKLDDESYHSKKYINTSTTIPFYLEAGTYTISVELKSPIGTNYRPAFRDKDGVTVEWWYLSSTGEWQTFTKTFTFSRDAYFMSWDYGAQTNDLYFKNFQIQKGSDVTPCEPYIEPTSTNIFLNEPLRKIGDYADYIDFKENKVVRNIYMRNLGDGLPKSTIYKYTNNGMVNSYRFMIDTAKNFAVGTAQSDKVFAITNLLPYGGYVARNNKTSIGISESRYFYFRLEGDNNYGVTSVSTFREFLKQYKPDLYYILATPIEEPLNIDLPKLTAKTTIIEVDTSLAPSNAYGKYIKR